MVCFPVRKQTFSTNRPTNISFLSFSFLVLSWSPPFFCSFSPCLSVSLCTVGHKILRTPRTVSWFVCLVHGTFLLSTHQYFTVADISFGRRAQVSLLPLASPLWYSHALCVRSGLTKWMWTDAGRLYYFPTKRSQLPLLVLCLSHIKEPIVFHASSASICFRPCVQLVRESPFG